MDGWVARPLASLSHGASPEGWVEETAVGCFVFDNPSKVSRANTMAGWLMKNATEDDAQEKVCEKSNP